MNVRVLLPLALVLSAFCVSSGFSADEAEVDRSVHASLRDVINHGADLFNGSGDHAGCYRIYEGGLLAVKPLLGHHPDVQKIIDDGIAEASRKARVVDRAFTLRRVLDDVRNILKAAPASAVVPEPVAKTPTLWERLDGAKKLPAVIDGFVIDVASDPRIDLERGGKKKIDVDQVSGAVLAYIGKKAGAGMASTATSLRAALEAAHLQDFEFNLAVGTLKEKLKAAGISDADTSALLKSIDVVHQPVTVIPVAPSVREQPPVVSPAPKPAVKPVEPKPEVKPQPVPTPPQPAVKPPVKPEVKPQPAPTPKPPVKTVDPKPSPAVPQPAPKAVEPKPEVKPQPTPSAPKPPAKAVELKSPEPQPAPKPPAKAVELKAPEAQPAPKPPAKAVEPKPASSPQPEPLPPPKKGDVKPQSSVDARLFEVAFQDAAQKPNVKKKEEKKAPPKKSAAFTDPKEAGIDFRIQGEYVSVQGEKLGCQVIALGSGAFQAVVLPGGLPGAGWDGKNKILMDGKLDGDKAVFTPADGKRKYMAGSPAEFSATAKFPPIGHKAFSGEVHDAIMTIRTDDGQSTQLKLIVRESPTLHVKPPEGAIVLFDGTNAVEWKEGKIQDGLLPVSANTKRNFKDFKLHLEFRTPFHPTARSQGRGNSGVYLHGKHEIQVLDSFGLEGKSNECGGFYGRKDPRVNMCFPPLSWQTFDVEFRSQPADPNINKQTAKVTVWHNGVKIHDGLEYPSGSGHLHLQNHGNPVFYRNIWLVEFKQ